MATITVSLPSDGDTIDVADYNTPINTIVNEINGSLNADNLAANAVTTAKIADGNVTNAKLSTTAGELGGAWKDWTPTLTNLSGGTLNFAKYTQIGKTILFRFKYTLAGAGVAGTPTVTVPVNMAISSVTDAIDGVVKFVVGGTTYTGNARPVDATAISLLVHKADVTYLTQANLTTLVPGTWAADDTIYVAGTYEAA
jgi:hypothetical protein